MEKVIHYRRRAEELMRLGDIGIDPDAMEWSQQALSLQVSDRSGGLCANAAGLLYVHAGIAMTDAMLIFLKTAVPDIEFGEAPLPTKNQALSLTKTKIRAHLVEADALFGQGHKRAAYLLAWSATEAAMKLLLEESASAPIPSPSVLIGAMRDMRKLTASETSSLSNALSVRNLLIHGFDDPSGIDAAYGAMSAISRRLIIKLNRQPSAISRRLSALKYGG